MSILSGASNNTIGGTTVGAGNLISGNIRHGVAINGSGTTGNVVQGNYIGTDKNGTADLGNTLEGVFIRAGASNNTIGGTDSGAGNVISGNNDNGVFIAGSSTTGNLIQGNYIGTDVTGTAALGNGGWGVLIAGGTSNNTIGGTGAGAANTIAFNGEDGVALRANAGTGNAIQQNSLFENTGLGIDLGDDGATPNDPGDADGSPNKLQNFPDITAVVISGGALLATYSVDSDPANATYPLRVEFFEADADDEEGQTFLGSDSYTATDYNGCGTPPCEKIANLGDAAALGVSPGDMLVATATDAAGNTSEFSGSFSVILGFSTRYIATTGDDTANDCINPATPCATLTHAVDQANAGDTIDLAAGT
ncbi:MAG: hypothetical protein IH820_07690 [Bacteroidetes bacterium]|nr:hypothetical protein [Bacteroidota bacterium]